MSNEAVRITGGRTDEEWRAFIKDGEINGFQGMLEWCGRIYEAKVAYGGSFSAWAEEWYREYSEAKLKHLAAIGEPNQRQRLGSIATHPQVVHKRIATDWHAAYELTTLTDDEIIALPALTRKEIRNQKREKSKAVAGKMASTAMQSDARLIVGDAEHLPLEAESIDAIITSPPYNMGSGSWPMGGSASGNPDDESRTPRGDGIGYGDDMPEPEYQAWQVRCLAEWYRVAKEGASLFYNHKVRQRKGTIIHPMDWLRDPGHPWTIRQEIVWDRGSTHNHSARLFWPHDERIYWMTKGTPTIPDGGIGAPTVWSFHGPVANTWHPAPFSEELPTRCLKAIGRPGIVVLDPFGGSMTTCRVAASMGYQAIGVDISPEYVEKAKGV